MKSSSACTALLFVSLTTPSLCAPIPVLRKACSSQTICPSLDTQWQEIRDSAPVASSIEPHLPAHQITPVQLKEASEKMALERQILDNAIKPGSPIRNPKLRAVLKAAIDDTRAIGQHPLGTMHKSISVETFNSLPASRPKNFGEWSALAADADDDIPAATMLRTMKEAAGQLQHKCQNSAPATTHKSEAKSRVTTVTYTYRYQYIRSDYTDVLVVSIVLLFLVAVALFEFVDKVIESVTAFFDLDQGTIRLEDGEFLLPDTPSMARNEASELVPESEIAGKLEEKSCLLDTASV